jgi:hypothetical protein
MKNVKIGALSLGLVGLMGSCVLSHTAVVTNNSIGSKKVEIKGTPFKKNLDFSYNAAMKKGKISKVGIVEFKVKALLIIPQISITMTGE